MATASEPTEVSKLQYMADENMIKSNLKTFLHVISKTVDCHTLLMTLPILEIAEKKKILDLSRHNPQDATTRILEKILKKDEPGLYHELLRVLGDEYPVMADVLKDHRLPDNSFKEKCLSLFTNEIVRRLNPTEVLPVLRGQGVITQTEMEEIIAELGQHGRSRAVLRLVLYLPLHIEFWYEEFLICLYENNCKDLAEDIDKSFIQGKEGRWHRMHFVWKMFKCGAKRYPKRKHKGKWHQLVPDVTTQAVKNKPEKEEKVFKSTQALTIANRGDDEYCTDDDDEFSSHEPSPLVTFSLVSDSCRFPFQPTLSAERGELIARGSYGEVYKWYNPESRIMIALKRFIHHDFRSEMQGSVKDFMFKHQKILEEYFAVKVTRHILEGTSYLHDNKILHRNIKASNVFLDSEMNAKLGDFEISKQIRTLTNSCVGSPYWMSPERIRGEKYGTSADICIGCTVVEMMTMNPPWHHLKIKAALFKIGCGLHPKYQLPPTISTHIEDFLSQTFQQEPLKRPRASELLKHAYIN